MEVKIIFTETIKPSSPTPQHLRNYKLSFLDQLAPLVYVPIIVFYSPTTPEISYAEKSNRLKKSLSETLTLYYPLAGRVKDIYSIDCNDEGASYTEAHVTGEMSKLILRDPQLPRLEKLLPFNPQSFDDVVLLGVQVNHFDCGGMAISICISHKIADASSAASFLTTWAACSSGTSSNIEGTIYDCTSIFPPQDTRSFSWISTGVKKDLLSDSMMKRFVFDGSKLSALREKLGNIGGTSSTTSPGCIGRRRPSRVETISALIWGAVIDSTSGGDEAKENGAGMMVDLRKRMIPPLPKLSLGNIGHGTLISIKNIRPENENRIDYYNYLAREIHESIVIVKDDYVRKIHEERSMFMEVMEDLREDIKMKEFFGISSWCRYPFYEIDFGWGKPIWVTTILKLNKTIILIDTKDGEGIEVWVTLPEKDMAKFEQNPDIRFYASFNPSI